MTSSIEPTSLPNRRLKRLLAALANLGRLAVETVFPSMCPSCGVLVKSTSEPLWCETCAPKILAAVEREYCSGCGRGTGPYERRDGLCSECRSHPRRRVAAIARVAPHDDPFRPLVLQFKHQRAPFDRMLGRLVAAALRGAPWHADLDAVIPVAMHWRRRLTRRHDPTRALAGVIGAELELPVVNVLKRTRYCRPQVGLSADQRRENVRGSFTVVPQARLQGLTVCLVDDVTTTGATLAEAAGALRKAGAERVYAAVVTKSDSTRIA
ncbi:MAG: ComF family protein [Phycisphaerae bacterium]|nr:ComF family protein [Phycisphaerae bacterium]